MAGGWGRDPHKDSNQRGNGASSESLKRGRHSRTGETDKTRQGWGTRQTAKREGKRHKEKKKEQGVKWRREINVAVQP